MQSRVNILLVAAAILLAVLVPLVLIAVLLYLVAPALIAIHITREVPVAQPISLRNLPLFRAPPAPRV